MALTERRTFDSFLQEKQLDPIIQETAWKLVEAHEAGVDISPYLELLEAGWAQKAGSAIGGAIGTGLGRLAGAATAGLSGGVMRGAQRAGRALVHGQEEDNPSFQLKDAIAFVNKAVKAAPNIGSQGKGIAQSLQQVTRQLDQHMKTLQTLEKQQGTGQQPTGATQPAAGTPQPPPLPPVAQRQQRQQRRQ